MPLACLWRTRSSVLGQLHLRPNALAAAGWGAVSLGVTLHTVLHVAPVEVCPCGPASSLPHQYGSCAACIAIDIAAACGGIVTERLGAAERRLERPIADDMMRLPHWRGIRARCHHARLRTTRTMGLSKQPEAASRRRRVLSALRRFGWIARCYACCPPLLTLKDNLGYDTWPPPEAWAEEAGCRYRASLELDGAPVNGPNCRARLT